MALGAAARLADQDWANLPSTNFGPGSVERALIAALPTKWALDYHALRVEVHRSVSTCRPTLSVSV